MIVEKIQDTYAKLSSTTIAQGILDDLYHADVTFVDPMHEIKGLSALTKYFSGMYENIQSIEFEYIETFERDNKASLVWNMKYQHPAIGAGKEIVVPGSSLILHDGNLISLHRDFFDSADLVYNHLPILKNVLGLIRKRMNQG